MHLTAAILAGGRAARFGGLDKSGLVVQGATILDRQIAALSRLTSDILIVGGDATHERARRIRDLMPGCGPLGGLYTALETARGSIGNRSVGLTRSAAPQSVKQSARQAIRSQSVKLEPCEQQSGVVVVLACDMPYVSADLLAHLAALAADADAVVPRTERGYHPLCAAYAWTCLDPIARRMANGQLRMSDLLGDVRLRVVPAEEIDAFGDPRRLLANLNTPAEYRSLDASSFDASSFDTDNVDAPNFEGRKSHQL